MNANSARQLPTLRFKPTDLLGRESAFRLLLLSKVYRHYVIKANNDDEFADVRRTDTDYTKHNISFQKATQMSKLHSVQCLQNKKNLYMSCLFLNMPLIPLLKYSRLSACSATW